jgi:hypothetical protein
MTTHDWSADVSEVAYAGSRLAERLHRLPTQEAAAIRQWLQRMFYVVKHPEEYANEYERWNNAWFCVLQIRHAVKLSVEATRGPSGEQMSVLATRILDAVAP